MVDFYLPQNQINNLKLNQKVKVTTDAFPQRIFSGKVSSIDNQIDSDTRNLMVRAKINNKDYLLYSGMFVDVTLVLDELTESLILPQASIKFSTYGETVFVITTAQEIYDKEIDKLKSINASNEEIQAVIKPVDGKALAVKEVFITTGNKRGDQIEVLSGISKNDQVVTSGQIKIKNGSLVKINNQVQPFNEANPQPIDN